MESRRLWQSQPSSSGYDTSDSNLLSSEHDVTDQDQHMWDSRATVPQEHYQNFLPSYEMYSSVAKSIKVDLEQSHLSDMPAKSFGSCDRVWLKGATSNEAMLPSASNPLTAADSSGLVDMNNAIDQSVLSRNRPAEQQYDRLLSIGDEQLSQYDTDEGEMSDADGGENSTTQPLGDSSSCNICGDVVAGFHCGAYVCEACKVCALRILEILVVPDHIFFCKFFGGELGKLEITGMIFKAMM
jgi:Zinc finger, C4 type (two domains)